MIQKLPRLTGGEERDGFEAAVFRRVHLQPVQLVHLVLENPDLVHEGHHPLGRHGRRVESSRGQQRGHVYGQRRLGGVEDEELAPAQPQQRHLWGGKQERSVGGKGGGGLTRVRNLQFKSYNQNGGAGTLNNNQWAEVAGVTLNLLNSVKSISLSSSLCPHLTDLL